MFVHYFVLGSLAYLARFAQTAPDPQLVYKCVSKVGSVCVIPVMKFEDSSQTFQLHDSKDKTQLNIKGGNIVALTNKQCETLRSFEKITIGPTGLGELCVAKSFREVSAENNNIRTLHANVADDGEFRIEILKLNNNKLDSQAMGVIKHFVALKELHLERNALTTLDMADFAEMTNLEELRLNNNRLNKIMDGMVALPKLSFFGLANNTLTGLNVQQWNMESLETLELASNNLTNVRGFEKLATLNEVTLAGNNWECFALEHMLESLESSAVTVRDGDRNCDGVRNTSICCTVEANQSEHTLLDELKKYSELEKRYIEANSMLEKNINLQKLYFASAIEEFKQKIDEKKSTPFASSNGSSEKSRTGCKKENEEGTETPSPSDPAPVTTASLTVKDEGESTASTDPTISDGKAVENLECPVNHLNPCESFDKDCICPKKELDNIKADLKALTAKLEESDRKVTNALTNQPYLQSLAALNRHEFRTMVKRGEEKVKEVNTKLKMLKDYIASELNKLV